jgi:hypothetical protein
MRTFAAAARTAATPSLPPPTSPHRLRLRHLRLGFRRLHLRHLRLGFRRLRLRNPLPPPASPTTTRRTLQRRRPFATRPQKPLPQRPSSQRRRRRRWQRRQCCWPRGSRLLGLEKRLSFSMLCIPSLTTSVATIAVTGEARGAGRRFRSGARGAGRWSAPPSAPAPSLGPSPRWRRTPERIGPRLLFLKAAGGTAGGPTGSGSAEPAVGGLQETPRVPVVACLGGDGTDRACGASVALRPVGLAV